MTFWNIYLWCWHTSIPALNWYWENFIRKSVTWHLLYFRRFFQNSEIIIRFTEIFELILIYKTQQTHHLDERTLYQATKIANIIHQPLYNLEMRSLTLKAPQKKVYTNNLKPFSNDLPTIKNINLSSMLMTFLKYSPWHVARICEKEGRVSFMSYLIFFSVFILKSY